MDARHHGKQGTAGNRKTKRLAYVLRIGRFAGPVVANQRNRWMLTWRRAPSFVDPIEDAGQPPLNGSHAQEAVKTASKLRRCNLSRISRADGRHMRRVENAGLEKRQLAVKFYAIDLE